MRICGQWFSAKVIHDIQSTLAREPTISRRALARKVCEWLNWKRPTGDWQEGGARRALATLHRRGLVRLPDVAPFPQQPGGQAAPLPLSIPAIEADLDELGPIELILVSDDAHKADYRSLMAHHPLGDKPLCGAKLRYLVRCQAGYLGALAFRSAHFALADRDRYIGWSETARRANLGMVIHNARFLILPGVRVPNLASHLLARIEKQVAHDWEARYGLRPVLMETFVHPDHDGACYKAANWREVGASAGRRDGVKKRLFLRPLREDWQERLKRTTAMAPAQPPEHCDSWAEQEFGAIRLWDNRLKRRLFRIAEDSFSRCEGSLPERAQDHAATMAAYRFMRNPRINMHQILDAHRQATLARCLRHPVVLAPQDTTYLNYSALQATEGLGPIGTTVNGPQGLVLHNALAFTPTGVPLGVMAADCWARDPEQHGRRRQADERESRKWIEGYQTLSEIQRERPETMFVSVCDREGDFFDLLAEAAKPGGAKLLVRADAMRHNAVSLEGSKTTANLWEIMAQQPMAGIKVEPIPRQGNRKAREAHLEVRFSQVVIHPPQRLKAADPVRCWAVYLKERETTQGATPIEWMLLTTVPTHTLSDACERSRWYAMRWRIEEFHRTLKSGCNIEDRQLGTATRIETCLAIDMVVAWRIFYMSRLARETPDAPCTDFFSEAEWRTLYSTHFKTPLPPLYVPTLREMVSWLAKLGGHLGRKSDGHPGTETLWRGLQKLEYGVCVWHIYHPAVCLPPAWREYPSDYLATLPWGQPP